MWGKDMEIRYAEGKDARDVYALLCELEEKVLDWDDFERVYRRNVEKEHIIYLLAIEEEQPIGFASLHVQELLHHTGNVAEIQELVVRGDWQGRGVGALLFAHVRQIAKECGGELLEVCCNQKRVRSHAFYEKQRMANSHYKFTMVP